MTELKTLKDFDLYFERPDSITSYVDVTELKQEAIKWLKSTDSRMNMPQDLDGWIKYFFNITEEDLK